MHSHINHLKALLKAAKESGVPKAYVHFFGDGRDTDPKSGLGHLKDLQAYMKEINYGQVVTLVGRYYAMDRDKRWERIQVAVDALVQGKGEESEDPVKTVEARYEAGETDEFLKVCQSTKFMHNGSKCKSNESYSLAYHHRRSRNPHQGQ